MLSSGLFLWYTPIPDLVDRPLLVYFAHCLVLCCFSLRYNALTLVLYRQKHACSYLTGAPTSSVSYGFAIDDFVNNSASNSKQWDAMHSNAGALEREIADSRCRQPMRMPKPNADAADFTIKQFRYFFI